MSHVKDTAGVASRSKAPIHWPKQNVRMHVTGTRQPAHGFKFCRDLPANLDASKKVCFQDKVGAAAAAGPVPRSAIGKHEVDKKDEATST